MAHGILSLWIVISAGKEEFVHLGSRADNDFVLQEDFVDALPSRLPIVAIADLHDTREAGARRVGRTNLGGKREAVRATIVPLFNGSIKERVPFWIQTIEQCKLETTLISAVPSPGIDFAHQRVLVLEELYVR